MSIPELAARWKLSRQTLYRRMATGELPYVEVLGVRRILAEVVEAVERGEDPAQAPPTPLRRRP
jgi:predicted DNA-binding transcriptional regulator AlpA